MWLNDAEAAKVLCESGDLEPRPHEYPALAAKGWKQYEFSWSKYCTKAGYREEAGTHAEGDMSAEQYEEVTKHLRTNRGSNPRKRAAPKAAREPETAEKKLKKANQNFLAACLRKCKSEIEKVVEKANTNRQLLPKLAEKGYPQEMLAWGEQKVQELLAAKEMCQQVYNEQVVKTAVEDAHELRSQGELVEQATSQLEKSLKEWLKGSGEEIKKLCA